MQKSIICCKKRAAKAQNKPRITTPTTMKKQTLELVGKRFALLFWDIQRDEGMAEFSHAGEADTQVLPSYSWTGTLRIVKNTPSGRIPLVTITFRTIEFWIEQVPNLEFEQIALLFLQGHGRYCIPRFRDGSSHLMHDYLAMKLAAENLASGRHITLSPFCMYREDESIHRMGIVSSLTGVPGSKEIPVPEAVQ